MHAQFLTSPCFRPYTTWEYTNNQWCSPRDQSLGLEAPRGQKIKSWSWDPESWSWSWGKSLGLDKKSWEFSRLLWVWLIAGTKNTNLGRDWVLVLFSTVLSELVYIRPVFISYTAMRVVCILFCSFCDHDMVTCSVGRVKSWSWS